MTSSSSSSSSSESSPSFSLPESPEGHCRNDAEEPSFQDTQKIPKVKRVDDIFMNMQDQEEDQFIQMDTHEVP